MRHEDDHHHDVETEPNKVFQILVISHENTCDKHEADIAIFRHAERQRDEPTWRTILLNIFDTKLEEVDAHERWHHQSRDGAIQLTNHQFASNRQKCALFTQMAWKPKPASHPSVHHRACQPVPRTKLGT